MERHSEFPLFVQSAVALFGFLLVLSFLGWALEPKDNLPRAATLSAEVATVQ